MKIFFVGTVCMVLFSCANNTKDIVAKKQIQPAPQVFRLATDSAFFNRQDTLFFSGQKFSGFTYMLYPNGDTSFLIAYVNGLQEGLCKKWYPGKKPAEVRLYNKGKKDGIQQAWWYNGNPKFMFVASEDEYEGESKEWNTNGALIKLFHYTKGQEEGSQQLFYDNGKIRANYIIIAGRRYGLLGTKNCVNVSDSIFNKR
jgi:hypothetical protein